MAIVRDTSVNYKVLFGKYAGKVCLILEKDPGPNKPILVTFIDSVKEERTSIPRGYLSRLALPGWSDDRSDSSYGLAQHFLKKNGSGSNLLFQENCFAQPRALKVGQVLASGEYITRLSRMGRNSSALICLSGSGWVEMAPRLPIALKGNCHFSFPIQLMKGERLVTNCLVMKNSECQQTNWVNIFLENDACIDTPSCLPLALLPDA